MAEPPCADRASCRACTAVLAISFFVLIGCSRRGNADEHAVQIVSGNDIAVVTLIKPSIARVTLNARSAASPTAPPTLRTATLHKTFADPPLPPELRDDGGLVPLPPRPAPSAIAMTLGATFEGAAPSAIGEEKP